MAFNVPFNFVIFVSLIFFVVFLLGIHNFLTKVDESSCEMTYMFEYPTYVEISLPDSVTDCYPKYGLYGYGEGRTTEDLRKMRFTGIPVLYIPGSGGSHKQGRSLASVSLRKYLNSRLSYHFDYFLVDFKEENSGIYGGVLEDQTKFVEICIKKILSLYNTGNYNKPTSVVLVGHSMGGLIAKGVLTDGTLDPTTINIIITLATPHKHPAVIPDSYIVQYYERINHYWNQTVNNVSHISLISVGGGNRDFMVRSDLIYDQHAQVNVLATSSPSVWCSTDHRSIVWCKQLVLSIVRALFESVDATTKLITEDKKLREAVFKYHLVRRSGGKKYSISQYARFATFETGGRWIENLQRQFSVQEARGVKINHFIMIRLIPDVKHEAAAIEAVNLDNKDWLFVCVADHVHQSVRMCESGENISNMTELTPSAKLRRKFVYLNLFHYKDKGFTHVIFRLPPSSEFSQVNVDVHSRKDRNLGIQVPKLTDWDKKVLIETTADNALHYSIVLNGLDYVWQAYNLNVETLTCKTATSHTVVSLYVPWGSNEHYHNVLVDKAQHTTVLKLWTPRPSESRPAHVRLTLDPSCKYQISIQTSWTSCAGQFVRYYWTMLPAHVVTIFLLTMRKQIILLNQGGDCVLFNTALSSSVKYYYIVLQIAMIGSKLLGYGLFLGIQPDWQYTQDMGLDFFLLPVLLYGVGVAIAYILGLVCYGTVIFSGQAAHKMALRFLAKAITGVLTWSEWIFSGLHQLPFVVACLLIGLSTSTCGGLAIWVGTVFYFLKLCKLYEEYLEELFKLSIKFVAKKFKGKKKESAVTEQVEGEKETVTAKLLEVEGRQTDGSEQTKIEETDASEGLVEEKRNSVGGDGDRTQLSQLPGDDTTITSTSTPAAAQVTSTSTDQHQPTTLCVIHFHVTMFLIWLVTALINVPSVLSWAKGFHHSVTLEHDPAFTSSIIFSISGAVLWQGDLPRRFRTTARMSCVLLYLCIATCLIYCTVHMYRLTYVTSVAVLTVAVDQVCAKYVSMFY